MQGIRSHEYKCNRLYSFKDTEKIFDGSPCYYVGGVPLLIPGHCDFSDEDYLSYPLSSPVKTEEDLANIHEHINICEAERVSIKKL